MSATDDFIIQDRNAIRDGAYNEIEYAIRALYILGVAESAIVASVRIMYNNIEEEIWKE